MSIRDLDGGRIERRVYALNQKADEAEVDVPVKCFEGVTVTV